MSSRPPTPPSKAPWEDEDFRFMRNGTACEWSEAYHPGGYHPVHLGDVIEERYHIMRKVGWGQYSTVWLAVDMKLTRYVSLKITLATQPQTTSRDVSLYKSHLRNSCPGLVTLYDIIKITGLNGAHDGLVFETMGPDLTALLRFRPEFQIGKPWERRFTKYFARRALLNTVQALHSLHERGIIHCDLHCGNILACIEPIEATRNTELRLKQSESDARPLKRKDGKKDLWAPLLNFTTSTEQSPLEGQDYDETSNDEHLIQLWEVIGPLPKPLLEKWRRADQYLDSSGNRLEIKSQEDGHISGGDDKDLGDGMDEENDGPPLADPGQFLSLEDLIMAEGPGDIDEAESQELLGLLRWVFQYDPAHRPSATDLINHPWLRSTS
ncbi:CMGC/SRPK protein kinase [Fusarium oxysporum Fo47]|uniref:non-specific serine/threonine protein kinase n=1 Tax=Fusarium oxysporum Fo47 TaxID=660027 RepID=W9JGE9_FUSOX|nr:CMGC/SRPK protein kinase [Fusarium oxysporum Fo47]